MMVILQKMTFFHWLDNETAFHYSTFSPRQSFCNMYRHYSDDNQINSFIRRGRGFSFHELDLAYGLNSYKVVSAMSSFQGLRYSLRVSQLDRVYKRFLLKVSPKRHFGLADKFLYITIQF